MKFPLIYFVVLAVSAVPATAEVYGKIRGKQAGSLSKFLKKEKKKYKQREKQRKSILEELDQLNSVQNTARQKMDETVAHHEELKMSIENLDLEIQRQSKQLETEQNRLRALIKLLYRVKRDGLISFVLSGDKLSSVVSKARVLHRAIRTHGRLTQASEERKLRLLESTEKLRLMSSNMETLLAEMNKQQKLLAKILKKRNRVLRSIARKQSVYKAALKEYGVVSKRVKKIFSNLGTAKVPATTYVPPPAATKSGAFGLPVAAGKITKRFGKNVHKRFRTVTYQKGIEIEAPHNSPVLAVSPGTVEYEGWIKGLGNVLIVHHGGELYSLSGHLFRSEVSKGATVAKGDVIGYIGDTGRSAKPSLYFELRRKSKAIDPLRYFSGQGRSALESGTISKHNT